MADDGNEVRQPFDVEAQDGKTVVGAVEGAPFDAAARASLVAPVESMSGSLTRTGWVDALHDGQRSIACTCAATAPSA